MKKVLWPRGLHSAIPALKLYQFYCPLVYLTICWMSDKQCTPWPRGYKTFFMLNSAEHEICPVNKSQITNNCKFFLSMTFSLLINMKMPTIVGIFIFICAENFMLSWGAWKKFYNLKAWSDTLFCNICSGSTLFGQIYLSIPLLRVITVFPGNTVHKGEEPDKQTAFVPILLNMLFVIANAQSVCIL